MPHDEQTFDELPFDTVAEEEPVPARNTYPGVTRAGAIFTGTRYGSQEIDE